jgi:hypothetical protein
VGTKGAEIDYRRTEQQRSRRHENDAYTAVGDMRP